ncbi:MAG: hypothetical protein ACE5JS_18345 [Nitrospinota bacterium]
MREASKRQPNPYLLALFTAVFAAVFSVVGIYYTSKKQTERLLFEQRLDSRRRAYVLFLEKIDRERSPHLSRLLNLGSVADRVATDGEIQALEDAFGELATFLQDYELYWQLSNDMSILRMYGSQRIVGYSKALLAVISGLHWEIALEKYPSELQIYYHRWRNAQEKGIAYGWEPKVTDEDRLTLIVAAKLFSNLQDTVRAEFERDLVD